MLETSGELGAPIERHRSFVCFGFQKRIRDSASTSIGLNCGAYPGALVLFTHDRFMLDRVAGVVLGLDGLGNTWKSSIRAGQSWKKSSDENGPAPAATGNLAAHQARHDRKIKLQLPECCVIVKETLKLSVYPERFCCCPLPA